MHTNATTLTLPFPLYSKESNLTYNFPGSLGGVKPPHNFPPPQFILDRTFEDLSACISTSTEASLLPTAEDAFMLLLAAEPMGMGFLFSFIFTNVYKRDPPKTVKIPNTP